MNNIEIIISAIDKILHQTGHKSADEIGSYIVGATIVRDDIDDYYKKYPLLEEVAELGAELETIKDSYLAQDKLAEIKKKFHELKSQIGQ